MSRTPDPQVQELAGHALSALREHGWTQHTLQSPTGQMCLWGSVLHASQQQTGKRNGPTARRLTRRLWHTLKKQHPADLDRLRPTLRKAWPFGHFRVQVWNDNAGQAHTAEALLEQVHRNG